MSAGALFNGAVGEDAFEEATSVEARGAGVDGDGLLGFCIVGAAGSR